MRYQAVAVKQILLEGNWNIKYQQRYRMTWRVEIIIEGNKLSINAYQIFIAKYQVSGIRLIVKKH